MAQAQRSRMSPEQYAQQLQQGGNIAEFVADVRRTKTLAQLLEETTITDASGNVVDLEALRPQTIQAPHGRDAIPTRPRRRDRRRRGRREGLRKDPVLLTTSKLAASLGTGPQPPDDAVPSATDGAASWRFG